MWGQRIWEVASDSEKPWSQWKYQACTVIKNCVNGDRGDNTANHWYALVPKLPGRYVLTAFFFTIGIMFMLVIIESSEADSILYEYELDGILGDFLLRGGYIMKLSEPLISSS